MPAYARASPRGDPQADFGWGNR